MMKRIAFLSAAFVLAACQTGEQRQASIDTQIATQLGYLNGKSVAAFQQAVPAMALTGAYDINEGRVFQYSAQGGSLVYPGSYGAPTVVQNFQCRMDVLTTPTGGNGADSWKINSIRHTGACNNIAIGM